MKITKLLMVFFIGLFPFVSVNFARSQCSPVVDQQQNTWTLEGFAGIGQQECYGTQGVQSFKPSYNNVTGVEVRLSQGPGLTFKIGLFDNLPITGATPLAEGTMTTQTSGTAQYATANLGKIPVIPGQTYYFGYCWVGGSQNFLSGASGNPYPDGQLYGLGGSLDFGGDFDLTFRTFSDPCGVNRPPVLAPVGSLWVYEGSPASVTLSATDPDGDVLEYRATGLPIGASLDASTGVFSWTPNNGQAGQYEVTFISSDGYFEDSKVTTITVYDGQGPPLPAKEPIIERLAPVRDQPDKVAATFTAQELNSYFGVDTTFTNIYPEDATVTVTPFYECPKSPDGFQVGDMCFDVTTDAVTGPVSFDSVEICLGYDETTINSENALKLLHYEVNRWVDITVSQDTVKNVICGVSSALSPFEIISSAGDIVAPTDPQPVYTPVDVSADFIDPKALKTGTYTVEISWGDGFVSDSVVVEPDGAGTATDSYEYSTPGVYTITLRVYNGETKDNLLGESVYRYLVIFDPDNGFVTGGGWIDSPGGAYAANPTLTGKANFGFVSKYERGANVPTGNTEFQFKVAELNFHSNVYEWLVIAGARAQFKGTGTINGMGDYSFLLTAIDGQQTGGGGTDRFRIKIWDRMTGTVIYDNQLDASDDSELTTVLGGGSIVIHRE